MRAWRYKWDPNYWKILGNIVTAFRNHVPFAEFQVLQAELIAASHAVCDNAENLHPGKGWKQFAHNTEKIKKAIAKMNATTPAADAVALKTFMKKDIQFAELTFAPGTDWYKNVLVPRVGSKEAEREFVVMKTEPKVLAIPGYIAGGEIRIPTDEKIVLSCKYYE
jgi:hypothetical protein